MASPSLPRRLQQLPAELLDIVISFLNNGDFLAARTTCRALCESSNLAFTQRFLDRTLAVVETATDVIKLTVVLRSPNFAGLPSTPQTSWLRIIPPSGQDLPRSRSGALQLSVPSKENVQLLLAAMPHLNGLTICPRHMADYMSRKLARLSLSYPSPTASQRTVPAITRTLDPISRLTLAGLASSNLNLRCLEIDTTCVEGERLLELLSAHSSGLRRVNFYSVALTASEKHPVLWHKLFGELYEMDLDELKLYKVHEPDHADVKVITEELAVDEQLYYGSSPDLGAARLATSSEACVKMGDEDPPYDLGSIDDTASFSRHGVYLGRNWVKKGLRNLLGLNQHPLK